MLLQVMSSLHQIEPDGHINFLTGLKIAHLALKHRLTLTSILSRHGIKFDVPLLI